MIGKTLDPVALCPTCQAPVYRDGVCQAHGVHPWLEGIRHLRNLLEGPVPPRDRESAQLWLDAHWAEVTAYRDEVQRLNAAEPA
jgi:hypothetical protein